MPIETGDMAHPREIARDFEVHLRTVFRWLKRGLLASENGRIKTDYRTGALLEWKSSCPLSEAQKRLGVSTGTMSAWRKKGLIKVITVMGLKRALLESLESVIQQRRLGTFSLHPTHSVPGHILNITRMGSKTLTKLLDKGIIPSDIIDGAKMIPNAEVERIRKGWLSSCRLIGAQRILCRDKRTIRRWVVNGKLKTKVVMGQRRVILRGIAKTPEEKQRLKEYLRLERKKYRKRLNAGKKSHRNKKAAKKKAHLKLQREREGFRAKRMSYNPKPMATTPIRLPDYKPAQIQMPGMGSKRLTSCQEAARSVGRGVGFIENLYNTGKLRGEKTDDGLFIFMLSLETLISKMRQRTFAG